MAFKFMENFYQYAAAGTALSAANTNFNTQWITHGTGPINITEGFDQYAKALTMSRTATANAQVERRFETTENTIIVGWAFRSTARSATTFSMAVGGNTFLELEWPKEFKIGSETGGATILLNKKYFVEISLEKSTGAVDMMVNGYPYLTTNVGTVGEGPIQCFWGWADPGAPADYVISNIYFVDSSAGEYQTFLGPQKVISRPLTVGLPGGWTPEPEGMDRVQIMNNIPPVAGQYTESDTVGTKDFYTSSVEVDADATITAVSVTSLLAKTDIDDQYVALAIEADEVTKMGADIEVPLQPTYFQNIFETDASDAAWDKASVEAVAIGPIVRPRP